MSWSCVQGSSRTITPELDEGYSAHITPPRVSSANLVRGGQAEGITWADKYRVVIGKVGELKVH